MLERSGVKSSELHSEILKVRVRKEIDERVIENIFMSANGGFPNADKVSSDLCVSVRTFNRYLKNSGTSYRKLRDQVRRKKATDLLLTTKLPIRTVADHLGYSDPSNFTKAFKRWFGMTPNQYRRANRTKN